MSATPRAALASPAEPMSTGLVVLVLSLLLGIQPITTDLYLPALPALTEGFGAGMPQAQLTLSALLLAFGVSQLFWGPLSDRYGRRPILLWGLSGYTLAAIGGAFSSSMDLLIVWRTLQGAAMGAAVMCARAIVRDLYSPLDGARAMSRGLTGLGVIACSGPLLGGLLSDLFGWRVALLAPALFGAGALTLIALRMQETAPAADPLALQPARMARNWLAIVRHPTFLAFSALSAASYGGLFTFLATSSFVFIKVLGLSKTQYGFVMFSISFVYVLSTMLCRRLLPRFGVRRTVAIAGALTLAGGTLMGLLAYAGVRHTAALVAPFYLFMMAHGVHQPCSQSGAVGPFPLAAGTASAINGFVMMVLAFAMGGWLGRYMDGTVFPMVHGIWFWSVLIALTAWTLVQKYGEPRGA
ncbi:MAG: Bcr/CflA family efflux MFS transporter [Comamonadaceae bacterium]|nr:MAG: Bcr/CflA family efflux MFS transporter [Comamonadaceae bacterium]